jgi:hypothetical protein
MEKLIRMQIIQHMKANKLFSNKQYSLIAGRSTALQLLEVLDKWSEPLDEGLDIDCIYTEQINRLQIPQPLVSRLCK